MTNEDLQAVELLWDYNYLNPARELPESADLVLAFGCKDTGVALAASEAHEKLGRKALLVMSGNSGRYTQGVFTDTEAEVFARAAIESGVPKEEILIEDRARNTGENIRFTHQLLESIGETAIRSAVLVHKPFNERRIKAAFEAQWPGGEEVSITTYSEANDFESYWSNKRVDPSDVARQVAETTLRLINYGDIGWQTPQEMSEEVIEALHHLRRAGYTE